MKDLLVGIDIGTTGLKTSFYTVSGVLVERAYHEYPLLFPRDGWVEMDPEIWWDAFCGSLREIFARGKVTPEKVAAVGITCTNALVLLDAEKKVLCPAIMQLDQRAAEQADMLKNEVGEDWVFLKTGNRISSGSFWGPTLRWLKEYRPDCYERTRYFLVPTGFLVMRLTGQYSMDHSRAAGTMLYHIHQKGWDDDLCRIFAIPKDKLPPIYKSHEIVGHIHADGARASGFMQGTPVIAGAMDTVGALVGLGIDSEHGALIMGTVGRLCIETNRLDKRFMNTVNADASNLLCMAPVNSAGASYKWLRTLLFQGRKIKGNVYEMMDRLAGKVRPGAEGLLYLPYLLGERSPIWDPYASGSFIGIKMKHRQEHFMRAVLEGVGFALAHNYEILKNELNVDPLYLYAGGGGAKSPLWMQIISDILGKPFLIPEELETETKGVAMLAGIGAGIFPDIPSAKVGWIQIKRGLVPNPESHELYRQLLPVFKELYVSNKQLSEKSRQLTNRA